jgi:hypothetical protein
VFPEKTGRSPERRVNTQEHKYVVQYEVTFLLAACFTLVSFLLFDLENGGDIPLRNVC